MDIWKKAWIFGEYLKKSGKKKYAVSQKKQLLINGVRIQSEGNQQATACQTVRAIW